MWWPLAVSSVPSQNRPYIGSTTNNSVWQLILGYNGLSRLDGSDKSTKKVVSDVYGGSPGLLRMFQPTFGINISLLFPLVAVISLLALWRFDVFRVVSSGSIQILIWSGWFGIHLLVFSFMRGIIHPYYIVVLSPVVGAFMGIGLYLVRSFGTSSNKASAQEHIYIARFMVAATACLTLLFFATHIVQDIVGWHSPVLVWLPRLTMVMSLLIVLYFAMNRILSLVIVGMSVLLLLVIPISTTIHTISTNYVGYLPTASLSSVDTSGVPAFAKPDKQLVEFLNSHYQPDTWVAMTLDSFDGAAIGLSTKKPVMTLGGFSGDDSIVSVDTLTKLVKNNRVRFFVTDSLYVNKKCLRSAMTLDSAAKTAPSSEPCKALSLSTPVSREINSWVQDNTKLCWSNKSWVVLDLSNKFRR